MASAAASSASAGSSSTSISVNRPGSSAWAARTRPQTAACAGAGGTASDGSVTPPRVSTTSRADAGFGAACQLWISPRTPTVRACTDAGSADAECGSSQSGTRATTTSGGVEVRAAARSSERSYSSPSRTARGMASCSGGVIRSHVRWNSDSCRGVVSEPRSWSREIGMVTNEPISATIRPDSSASVSSAPPSAAATMRTRTVRAPRPWIRTRRQANGIRGRSVGSPASSIGGSSPSGVPSRPRACSEASSSAGCRSYPPASVCSGKCSSARTLSPERHAVRSDWNAGPQRKNPCSSNRR